MRPENSTLYLNQNPRYLKIQFLKNFEYFQLLTTKFEILKFPIESLRNLMLEMGEFWTFTRSTDFDANSRWTLYIYLQKLMFGSKNQKMNLKFQVFK